MHARSPIRFLASPVGHVHWPTQAMMSPLRDKDRLQQDHEGKQGHREDLYFKYNIAQVTLQNQENIVSNTI
jgi:hypothetical protein